MQKRKVPSWLLVAGGFVPLARQMLAGLELREGVLVRLPKDSFVNPGTEAELRHVADGALQSILTG